MTIKNLQKWIERDIPRTKIDEVIASANQDGPYGEYKFYIYTDTNKYAIYANDKNEKGYLGCMSQSRKERPGEDWFRGNDLPDGPLTEKTWREILAGIVRYELQDVVKRDHRKPHADITFPVGPSLNEPEN